MSKSANEIEIIKAFSHLVENDQDDYIRRSVIRDETASEVGCHEVPYHNSWHVFDKVKDKAKKDHDPNNYDENEITLMRHVVKTFKPIEKGPTKGPVQPISPIPPHVDRGRGR